MARFRLELGPSRCTTRSTSTCARRSTRASGSPAIASRRSASSRAATAAASSPSAARSTSSTREQRLERTRGRGTFVLPPRLDRDVAATLSFTEEMQRRGLDPETRLVAARPEAAGEAVAAALGLEPGSPTLYLERLRLAGGEPLLLEMVHLPAERFPGLLASDLEHGSLYDLLTERYGVRWPGPARRSSRCCSAPARRGCSASGRGTPALLVEGIAFTADGTPGRVRPDLRPRRSDPLLRRTRRRPAALDACGRPESGGGTDP